MCPKQGYFKNKLLSHTIRKAAEIGNVMWQITLLDIYLALKHYFCTDLKYWPLSVPFGTFKDRDQWWELLLGEGTYHSVFYLYCKADISTVRFCKNSFRLHFNKMRKYIRDCFAKNKAPFNINNYISYIYEPSHISQNKHIREKLIK